jgi:hypothetical protein
MELKIKSNNGFITVECENSKPKKCSGCGKEIIWAKTKDGKAMPISRMGNGDLVCHFYDCSKADKFRRK